MTSGVIFDTMRFAVHDGPGIRTTVFFKGCPLRCLWCHNPESQRPQPELMLRPERCIGCGECVRVCPTGAAVPGAGHGPIPGRAACRACGACARVCPTGAREMVGRVVSVEDLVTQVERDTPFFDESGGGVTVSGGEPLAQPAFLAALLSALKERGLRTCLDTSGYGPVSLVESVAPLVDTFLYDLKLMDPVTHERFTGVSNAPILHNLRRLAELSAGARRPRLVIRIPVIPGVNDDSENLARTAEFVSGLPLLPPVSLLPYHQTGLEKYRRLGRRYLLPDTAAPSESRMQDIAAGFEKYGLTVRIGR